MPATQIKLIFLNLDFKLSGLWNPCQKLVKGILKLGKVQSQSGDEWLTKQIETNRKHAILAQKKLIGG
jgi:hypothetical protein